MNRRDALKTAAGAFVAALGEPLAWRAAAASGTDGWAAEFAAALKLRPWLLGWQMPAEDRLATPQAQLSGRLPADLAGRFYRNGPAGHEVGGRRYHHWFDGDGMVQRFDLSAGGVSHLGRYVLTAKRRREQTAGRPRVPGFGTSVPGATLSGGADDMNPANINVLHHGGALYALWEAGSPYRIDPENLATLGRHAWSEELAGLPFTAHPRVDPDGGLWAFGYAMPQDLLLLYHIGADGRPRRFAPVRVDAVPPAHDFVLTRRHLVIPLPPLHQDADAFQATGNVLDSLTWQPGLGLRVLVVDRDDFTRQRWYQLPAAWIFHYGNGWEESDGSIRFDCVRYDDPGFLTGLAREVMRGATGAAPAATLAGVRLGPDGRASMTPLDPGVRCEFPRVDPRRSGERHRALYAVLRRDAEGLDHPLFNAVGRLDLEGGSWDAWRFAATELAEEHVFVPRPGATAEGDGWLVGTSLDYAAGVTRLNVFDAGHIAAGPLAVASLPYALPLGFHGSFVPG